MISIRNLHKSYGNLQVLNDINIEFKSGKVYGIVGENGAGKTTLFKCIAGLEIFKGKIETSHNPLKDVLGFLPTQPIFMSYLTGKEYLKLSCIARDNHRNDFVEQNIFNLPLDSYAVHYSTGMQKKLAFMAILMQQNEVFILDEPYNGVDIHSNMMMTAIIKKLKSEGKIVLISSHIFSTLKETCDELIVLEKGKGIKHFYPKDYEHVEQEMKNKSIEDVIERLKI